MSPTGQFNDALRAAITDSLARRGQGASICPSEAARAVGAADWRELMEPARTAARELAREGRVRITQRDRVLDPDEPWRGPIRIRLA